MPIFKKYKLGDIAEVQTGPFGSQLHAKDYQKIGTPIITVEHLNENTILHNELPLVSDADKERLKKYLLKHGDIVFSRVGSVDRRAYVSAKEDGWLFSGRCLRIRTTSPNINSKYLSYYFGLETFKEYIRQIAVGATMPSLNTLILSEIEFDAPDLSTQTFIASILSSLDDKIELNRRMNQTLEQIAATLFKKYFVDDIDPDNLPDGWSMEVLSDHFEVDKGLSYKGSGLTTKGNGIPMHNLNSVYEGGGYKYEGLKFYKGDFKPKHHLQPWDVIVANTEQGHKYLLIGYPAIVPSVFQESGIFTHHIYRLRAKENTLISNQYLYYLLLQPYMREQIIAHTNGTTVNMLYSAGLEKPKFIHPPKDLIENFSNVIKPIWKENENLHSQSEKLVVIRDSLLPKLMSGQIDLSTIHPNKQLHAEVLS